MTAGIVPHPPAAVKKAPTWSGTWPHPFPWGFSAASGMLVIWDPTPPPYHPPKPQAPPPPPSAAASVSLAPTLHATGMRLRGVCPVFLPGVQTHLSKGRQGQERAPSSGWGRHLPPPPGPRGEPGSWAIRSAASHPTHPRESQLPLCRRRAGAAAGRRRRLLESLAAPLWPLGPAVQFLLLTMADRQTDSRVLGSSKVSAVSGDVATEKR